MSSHSTWAASASDRNFNCPGAIAMTDGLAETTSSAADWGTCCHAIAADCLQKNTDAAAWVGLAIKGKQFEFEVDDEMADTAQVYVDYCRALMKPGVRYWIEENFSLAALNPPFDAGGTGDFVAYDPDSEELEVVDLKGGRGVVVDVQGNRQMRSYGLGAMLKHGDLKVSRVKVTIVQPRAQHRDGIIRSETFHVADLIDWTVTLKVAMERSALALKVKAEGALPGPWAATYLKAGDHCQFCGAAGFCPALEERARDAAGVWFDDLDVAQISNTPDSFSPEELSKRLDMIDTIREWCNAVEAYAHRRAEAGVAIPNYQLVPKIGNRAWKVDEMAVFDMLTSNGVANDKAYTHKIVSPAQAEKLLGAKKKQAVDGLTERPSRGTNLARIDKTTRSAIPPAVDRHFDVLD